MPLDKSGTKQAFKKNVDELYHHGTRKRSLKQILAIAYAVQRRGKGKK